MARTMPLRPLIAGVVIIALAWPAQARVALPAYPDGTNGCSGGLSRFARLVLQRVPRWESCCYDHDRAYRRGGTWTARLRADRALLGCAAAFDPAVAAAMWFAVRALGTSFWQFDWRQIGVDHAAQHEYRRAGAEYCVGAGKGRRPDPHDRSARGSLGLHEGRQDAPSRSHQRRRPSQTHAVRLQGPHRGHESSA